MVLIVSYPTNEATLIAKATWFTYKNAPQHLQPISPDIIFLLMIFAMSACFISFFLLIS